MAEEKTASFKYERCIIDLTEFSHKVSVEVRVYDTEETMRRAACIDLVESSIESNDLDRPIGDAAFEKRHSRNYPHAVRANRHADQCGEIRELPHVRDLFEPRTPAAAYRQP